MNVIRKRVKMAAAQEGICHTRVANSISAYEQRIIMQKGATRRWAFECQLKHPRLRERYEVLRAYVIANTAV